AASLDSRSRRSSWRTASSCRSSARISSPCRTGIHRGAPGRRADPWAPPCPTVRGTRRTGARRPPSRCVRCRSRPAVPCRRVRRRYPTHRPRPWWPRVRTRTGPASRRPLAVRRCRTTLPGSTYPAPPPRGAWSPRQPEHDRPVGPHAPRPDVVEVIERAGPPHLSQGLERRLNVAGLVDRAAHEQRLATVPPPGRAKPRVALGEDGLLKLRGPPAPAPVGADLHTRDPSATGPGDPRDLPPPLVA